MNFNRNIYIKEENVEQISQLYSFETLAYEWLNNASLQLKDSTVIKYTNLLTKYILPTLNDELISNISREKVNNLCNNLLSSGGKDGNGLSPKTVTCSLSLIKVIFKYASEEKNISTDNLNSISIKNSTKPMRVLSIIEQQKLSNYLFNNMSLTNIGILICLYTGIRLGEVCALKWEDILVKEHCIYINKTMQRLQNNDDSIPSKTIILIANPKSECSIRKIPLPKEIYDVLVSMNYSDDSYLLTGCSDKVIEPRTMQNKFKKVLMACGISNANFHCLRHTFATRCIELGFDLKSLSEILGHSSVNITLNRYVHPSMELKQKNMDKLSGIIKKKI